MKNLFHKSFPLLLIGLLVGSVLAQPVEAQQRQRGQQMSQEQREEMRERLQNLTPEQREALREQMTKRRANATTNSQRGEESPLQSMLTPEQREQIKTLRLDVMEKRLPLKNQLNEAKARLKTVSTGSEINEKEAKKLIDSMHQLEADIKKLEWDLRMDVRAMLTEEQQVRFDQMPWPRMAAERGKAPMRRAKMVKKAYEHRQNMHKKHQMMY
ncbi:MAG: periplasmic heavy metal sensor [Balneolaceae bacterium]|nr:periplasmic heavy metal sensor [Balneolaceae bacterium]